MNEVTDPNRIMFLTVKKEMKFKTYFGQFTNSESSTNLKLR